MTENNNSSTVVTSGLSEPLRILLGSATILAGILGIIGNLLVIFSIVTTPKLRTSHNAFVVNLSLVDLLLSVVSIPFFALTILAEGWPLDQAFCRLDVNLSLLFWDVSVLTLAAVATNRYLLITKPPQTYSRFCGRKQIGFFLLFAWMQGVGSLLIAEFAIQVDIQYQALFSSCALNPLHPITHQYITVVICSLVFTVMILIPVQYLRVFLAVRASRQRVRQAVIAELSSAGEQPPSYDQVRPPESVASITKDEIKLIKMFVLLTFVFAISYLPVSIVYMFGVYNPKLFRGARFGMFILTVAPAINPFIYAWMNKNIRASCFRLITCRKFVPRSFL